MLEQILEIANKCCLKFFLGLFTIGLCNHLTSLDALNLMSQKQSLSYLEIQNM